MRIAVCIKQVPEVSEIRFDPARKTLIREGVTNLVNPFDRRAVTQAVALAREHGGEVLVLTMGPPQAREALVECLAMGADRAIHLEDRAFAGSDTLATARALARALGREAERGGFDIIFCGKYSVDAETGQVGPELAELLDIPHVSGATALEYRGERLLVRRETDEGFETIEVELPCLLTAAERLIRPTKVKDADLEAARSKPITHVRARDLSEDASIFGFAGSPTQVSEIYEQKSSRSCRFVSAKELVQLIIEQRRGGRAEAGSEGYRRKSLPRTGRSVWSVVEFIGEKVRPVSFELLGESLKLADRLGGEAAAVVIGNRAVDGRLLEELAAHGAERIYRIEHSALAEYSAEGWANALARAIELLRPWAVLVPATADGRDYAPRVAARLGLGLTGDCIGLELDEREQLQQLKPAFGGQIVAPILSRSYPQMATVRPGMLAGIEPDYSRKARVERLEVDPHPIRTRLLERTEEARETVELEQARIVICVGMGIGGPENLPLVRELAERLGASIGATRRVVDAGWLERQYQVGLTGKAIAPEVYLGVGVRGAFNHTIGIQRAKVIAAINKDREAEIFKSADYGIIGDSVGTVKEMIEILKR